MAEHPDPVMKILLDHLGPLVTRDGIGTSYTSHAGLPSVLANRIQADLLAGGLLVEPGGDTREEWRQVSKSGFETGVFVGTEDEVAARFCDWFTSGMRRERRTVHTGPWIEVPNG